LPGEWPTDKDAGDQRGEAAGEAAGDHDGGVAGTRGEAAVDAADHDGEAAVEATADNDGEAAVQAADHDGEAAVEAGRERADEAAGGQVATLLSLRPSAFRKLPNASSCQLPVAVVYESWPDQPIWANFAGNSQSSGQMEPSFQARAALMRTGSTELSSCGCGICAIS